MYKKYPQILGEEPTGVMRISDGACIPFNENNADYQTYLKWLDGYELQITAPMKMEWVKVTESNTPLPADEE